jgi:hypothetical protein
MRYNIVTNYKICLIFKRSSHFRVNLGLASTMEANSGDRLLNQKDDFAYFYNTTYRGATVLGQGNIGNIKIYSDPYIKEDLIAMYWDKEEFIFEFDQSMVNEKGVDFYLGHLIKKIEEEHDFRIHEEEKKKEESKQKVGNPDAIAINPGAVSYADLMAYLEKQRAERLKS